MANASGTYPLDGCAGFVPPGSFGWIGRDGVGPTGAEGTAFAGADPGPSDVGWQTVERREGGHPPDTPEDTAGDPDPLVGPIRGRIFVLDGVKEVRTFLSAILERRGHTVTLCDDPEEAIATLSQGNHDLLITCILLRKFGGLEVLHRLRTVAPDLPTLVCSAVLTAERRREAEALGAMACLEKPFRIDDLYDAIDLGLMKTT